MGKIVKNNLTNSLVILVIFSLVAGWFYSGWPQIWQNPPIPPEIQETMASTTSWSVATAATSWVVPAGVYSITVKVWGGGGGGGGGGDAGTGSGGAGGGGGFASSTITVTPGATLTIRVGGAGAQGLNSASCGGSGSYCGGGGGGGGFSMVSSTAGVLIQAGGGGGGGAGGNNGEAGGKGGAGGGVDGVAGSLATGDGGAGGGAATSTGPGLGGAAGAGGGTDGEKGSTDGTYEGGDGGASATAACGGAGGTNGGGAGGNTSISADRAGGGGGGGGRYGGGGGEEGTAEGAGGGGGGNSQVTGTNTAQIAGSGIWAGASTTDSNYVASAGVGGTGGAADTSGNPGNAGLVVIILNTAPSFTGAGPTDDPYDPVTVGNPVTFSGTAVDPESDTWYLAACKTNWVATTTPPTCAASQDYCVSASAAASNSSNSCNWTSTGSGAQTWYTFACDSGNALGIRCSSASTSDITVNAVSISISRTDSEGTIEYGSVNLSDSTSTEPTTGTNQVATFLNNGNAAEKFSIKTENSTNWTAINTDPSAQTDQFRHSFATTSPVTYWKPMGIHPAYAIASSTVDANASLNVYLKIETPGTDTSNYAQQSITVTVFAEAP